ncbi:hypothetical protein RB653_004728 [Dictyostelium firmibasis]|uniref:NTF2 domain-containing protein n=1 Tax=Dictyostelium firmibasis TaxID=79012 RepID=A0AAN7UA43_9MYCE
MEIINTVAASFLLKYFTLLIKTPENLKDFYHQNSKITRRFENGKANILTSYDNINEFLVNNSAKFGGNANISSIDCQPLGESIFMTCIGSIGFDGNVRRFLQSFYLEKIQGSFFISNDIFAFTSDEIYTVAVEQPDEASNIEQDYQQTVEVESTTTNTVVATSPITVDVETVKQPEELLKAEPTTKASNIEQVIETTSTTTTAATTAAVVVTSTTPTPTETKVVEPTKKSEPITTTTTPAEKPKETAPVTPVTNQTWAQLINDRAAQTASASEEPAQSSRSSSSSSSQSQPSSSSPSSSSISTTNKPQKEEHHFAKDGNTVFISFKSSKVDQGPIKEAFNQFGIVSNVRILTGYGFVEFEKAESVQNALTYASTHSNKIDVAGNIIKVEERRALTIGKQQQSPPPSLSQPLKQPQQQQQQQQQQPPQQQPQQQPQPQQQQPQLYKRQPQNNGTVNLKYNNQQNKPNLNGNNINNNNNQNNFRKPQKVDNKKETSK